MAIKNSWAAGEVLTNTDLTDTMKGVYVNAQTGTTYTFGTADGFVTLSNASGGTATIPANSTAAFNTGAVIGVMNAGTAGSFTIGTAAGVTLNAVSGTTTLAPLESATLVKLATNTWQLRPAAQPAGLMLITTQTFSAVASVSVNNCFTATYENYLYVGHVACSAAAQVYMRLRVSGADNSSSNYLWGGAFIRWATSTAVTGENSNGVSTAFQLCDADGNPSFFEGKVFSPFASRLTGYTNKQAFNNGGSLDDGYSETFSGSMTVSTSYTGFSLYPGSGNITGSISVYGLKL